jgi:hypothetical protein
MWQLRRSFEIIKKEGLISLIKKSILYAIYLFPSDYYNNKIWPLLPAVSTYGTYNQVEVKGTHPMKLDDPSGVEINHKIFDSIIPWDTPSKIKNFKNPSIEQIYKNYEKGDKIVIIGGGNGVSAVHSARIVGSGGEVKIYEGDESRVRDVKRTLEHNQVFDICEVNHSIVGEAHLVKSPGNANIIKPSDLPKCDALEMDCEGAEFEILKDLENLPNKIIVELHHKKESSPYSSPDTIESILKEKGYCVQRYNGPWVNGLLVAKLE